MKNVKIVIESILIMALCFSIVYIGVNFALDKKSEMSMNKLRNEVKASRLQLEEISIPQEVVEKNKSKENNDIQKDIENIEVATASETKAAKPILDIYEELHEKNENFAGWLFVDGTDLEYPVMQGPDNKFYLSHDIDRKYDKHGMLIMDYNCDSSLNSPQLIVYGHNVNSGKMFGELLFYKEEAYCNYHPVIAFDTLYDRGEYEIFSAFMIDLNEAQKEIGLFTSWNFEDEKTYNDFVDWAMKKSMYKREFKPEFGDEILTLVTCEHSTDEGRFVVMAAKNEGNK